MDDPQDRFFERIEGEMPVLRVRIVESPPAVAVMMVWPTRHDTGAAVHLGPELARTFAKKVLQYADEAERLLTQLN